MLGSVSVLFGNREYAMASRRAMAILAMLALTPRRTISSDQLEDELWEGRKMANARNALQVNVGRLRRFLASITHEKGDEIIRTVGGGYLLDVSPNLVDAHRFQEQADAGAELVRIYPAQAVVQLEQALSLWRGAALTDAHDGLRIRIAAADLEDRRVTAYEDLITARLAVGARRTFVSELRQMAAEHPERERLSELLMLALYRDGRQSEALDVFHTLRRRLAGDLGLEPGPALHRAYQAILEQDELLFGGPRQVLTFADGRR
ncbi:AfsR/SARP family transcriptional regulator [Streptomyces sp. NPDC006645]|uniref:AfsR/SARP family transcriptional regulator n=1 Tax=unclassified Streptomyces TaxID=2593676 RepID=UPI0033B612DF